MAGYIAPIVIIILMHVVAVGIQLGFGDPTPECKMSMSTNPMCGTPVEDFFQLGRDQRTAFGSETLGRLPLVGAIADFGNAIQSGWALLTKAFFFDYQWLHGDALLLRFGLWCIQAILGAIAIGIIINLAVSRLR